MDLRDLFKKKESSSSLVLVDTNVLLFTGIVRDNYVVCSTVIEELEKHKTGFEAKNKNSRNCLRFLKDNLQQCIISVAEGETNDDKIINTAKKQDLTLLTNDIAMIVKASTKQVRSKFFEPNINEQDTEITYQDLVYNTSSANVDNAWGLKPKNKEQQIALNVLLDENISLVNLIGRAGSGKTILALAAALELCDRGVCDGIVVVRKIVEVGGNAIGFLKGDKDDKLLGSAGAILDNLNVLSGSKKNTEQLLDTGMIEFESLGFLRGRSLANQVVIVDEAQNTTAHEIRTILTRIGENAKVILMGDTQQRDLPHLSELNNGLAIVSHAFKDSKIASGIVLQKCLRSELAHEAIEKLKKV